MAGSLLLTVDSRAVAEVELADTYLRRLRGMLGRRRLPEALLLVPGGSVHGVGMAVALDVAFLAPRAGATARAGGQRVLRASVLRPLGLLGAPRGTRTVLEAPQGSFGRWGLHEDATVELQRLAGAQAPA